MMRKTKKRPPYLPSLVVMKGRCLGHIVYRGFAPLSTLARISRADIFDQEKNPLGTQRNLSVTHARKAYKYVSEDTSAFFPEIILNLRDSSYVTITKMPPREAGLHKMTFSKDPSAAAAIVVSRLDGNHRLWFADGTQRNFAQVDRPVSFCLLEIEELKTELALFRDINDNQMGMNTSHLQNITARLLGEKALKVTQPALYIVQKLQRDKGSPFYQRIHEGGRIRKGATLTGLTVANLTNAIRDMLSRSAKISQFPDAEAQYEVIKNYWLAVKKWLPKAWDKPSDYIIFRGVGLYAISYVGVEIIDRCLLKGKYQTSQMYAYLKTLESDGFLSGQDLVYAGRAGGRKMANDLLANLAEDGEVSLNRLQRLILDSKAS